MKSGGQGGGMNGVQEGKRKKRSTPVSEVMWDRTQGLTRAQLHQGPCVWEQRAGARGASMAEHSMCSRLGADVP